MFQTAETLPALTVVNDANWIEELVLEANIVAIYLCWASWIRLWNLHLNDGKWNSCWKKILFLQASTYHEKEVSAYRLEVWKMRGKISVLSCGRKANFGSNYQSLQENKGSRNGFHCEFIVFQESLWNCSK